MHKKKLVIFNESSTDFVTSGMTRNLLKYVTDKQVIVYDENIQKNLAYLSKNKDSKIYEKVLDYCQENNDITNLFISFLYYPEYLLTELCRRKKLNFKISFPINWRLILLSKTRKYVIKQLIRNKNISKLLIHVTVQTQEKFKSKKICEIYDPLYHKAEIISREEALKKLKLNPNKFWLLFFGNMFYGKGLDLLVEVMKDKEIKKRNINLLIGSSPERLNFDFNIDKVKQMKNIKFNDFFIPEDEVKYYFNGVDLVVLPYRSSYKDGGSAVLIQACQYDKPIIAPDVFPLNKVTKQYKLGELFEPNSIDSLKNSICRVVDNPTFDISNKRKDYIKTIQSWHTYIHNMF